MSVPTNNVYRLLNKGSQETANVQYHRMDDKANIHQFRWRNRDNEKWLIIPIPDDEGVVRVVNVNSGKVMEVADSSKDDKANVQQYHWKDEDHQKWNLIDAGDGYYRLVNKNSGKVLDVAQSGDDAGNIQQYTWHDGDNQLWKIEKVAEEFVAGEWAVEVSNGRFLSQDEKRSKPDTHSAIGSQQKIQFNFVSSTPAGQSVVEVMYTNHNRLLGTDNGQVILTAENPGGKRPSWTMIPEGEYRFSLRTADNQYLGYDEKGDDFSLVTHGRRQKFTLLLRIVEDAADVGSLMPGEIALYQSKNYTGNAIVLHDDFARLSLVDDFDNTASSIRVGPDTAATVYMKENYQGTEMDVFGNVPNLEDTAADSSTIIGVLRGEVETVLGLAVGNDTISSVKVGVASLQPYKGNWAVQLVNQSKTVIVNKNSLKMLHVDGGSRDDKANVNQDHWRDITSEMWAIEPVDDTYVRIVNHNSGKVLDVVGASTENKANVQQYTWNKGDNQKWELEAVPGGYYQISNKNSGKVLEVANSSTKDHGNVQQNKATGADNQLWQIITLPKYLNVTKDKDSLSTDQHIHSNTEFNITEKGNGKDGKRKVIIEYPKKGQYVGIDDEELAIIKEETTWLLVEEGDRLFSLQDPDSQKWVHYHEDKDRFSLKGYDDRQVFCLAVKVADHHCLVGALEHQEIAFYADKNYQGKTWVFYQQFADISFVIDFHESVSSVRLGPGTQAVLFKEDFFSGNTFELMTDIPDLGDKTITADAIHSLQTYTVVPPEARQVTIMNAVSQDYTTDKNDKLQEFTTYRSTIQLPHEVRKVLIAATEKVTISIAEKEHTVDAIKTVEVKPDTLSQIIVNVTPDSLSKPALKMRTDTMPINEYFFVYPDQDMHAQMNNMQKGALWQLVDQKKYDESTIDDVQTGMSQLTSLLTYDEARFSIGSHHLRTIKAENMQDAHWRLDLGKTPRYTPLSLDEALQINQQATEFVDLDRQLAQSSWWDRFKQKAIDVTHIVIHTVKKKLKEGVQKIIKEAKATIHFIEDGIHKAVQFTVQLAEHVGQLVETILDKIQVALTKFVEFLQFVFDWEDIKQVHDALVQVTNYGLDFLIEQLGKAEKPITDFLQGVEDTIDSTFESMIQQLTDDPKPMMSKPLNNSATEKSGWLMAKVSDNSHHATHSLTTFSLDSTQSLFQEIFNSLSAAADNSHVKDAFSQAGQFIEEAFSNGLLDNLNYLLAGLLEALKGSIEFLAATGANLIQDLLKLAEKVLQEIKDLLNKSIDIPLIGALYKKYVGGDLTFLNLSIWLLAVPATIMSKLLNIELPFDDDLFTAQTAVQTSKKQSKPTITDKIVTWSQRIVYPASFIILAPTVPVLDIIGSMNTTLSLPGGGRILQMQTYMRDIILPQVQITGKVLSGLAVFLEIVQLGITWAGPGRAAATGQAVAASDWLFAGSVTPFPLFDIFFLAMNWATSYSIPEDTGPMLDNLFGALSLFLIGLTAFGSENIKGTDKIKLAVYNGLPITAEFSQFLRTETSLVDSEGTDLVALLIIDAVALLGTAVIGFVFAGLDIVNG